MGQFDWLATSFETTPFTVFDTETTGLEPRLCRVVEAGAIRFDAKGIKARFNALINPGTPMPPEVTKINGITDAMLAGQPDAAGALPDFIRFIGDSVLIAHNAPFDVSFINEELARLGKPALKNRVIDTRIFAKEMFPDLPKYALQELAVRFGIQAIDAHRAEDDARVCMELFLVCLKRLREKLGVQAGQNVAEASGANAPDATAVIQPLAGAEGAKTAQHPSVTAIEEPEQEDLFGDDFAEEGDYSEESPE